jgi:hypothetical protein
MHGIFLLHVKIYLYIIRTTMKYPPQKNNYNEIYLLIIIYLVLQMLIFFL